MKKRILVVDDQPGLAQLLQRVMKDFEVREVPGAQAALELAAEWRPDVFLLDLVMPDMHGMDLAAKLALDPQLRDVPVIFLSALIESRGPTEEPVQIGGYAAFGKPFNIDVMRAYIARQLDGHAGAKLGELKVGYVPGEPEPARSQRTEA